MSEGLEDDIAVIEEYDEKNYEWTIVSYIGLSRAGGTIEFSEKQLRIRYLKEKADE